MCLSHCRAPPKHYSLPFAAFSTAAVPPMDLVWALSCFDLVYFASFLFRKPPGTPLLDKTPGIADTRARWRSSECLRPGHRIPCTRPSSSSPSQPGATSCTHDRCPEGHHRWRVRGGVVPPRWRKTPTTTRRLFSFEPPPKPLPPCSERTLDSRSLEVTVKTFPPAAIHGVPASERICPPVRWVVRSSHGASPAGEGASDLVCWDTCVGSSFLLVLLSLR